MKAVGRLSILSRYNNLVSGKKKFREGRQDVDFIEVNSWIWDKIGLEFSDINIKSTIESKRCSK